MAWANGESSKRQTAAFRQTLRDLRDMRGVVYRLGPVKLRRSNKPSLLPSYEAVAGDKWAFAK